jgi:ribosomal protein L40E
VVSNEEIKRMLDAKRKGISIKNEKIKSENYKICTHCKTKNPEKALFCVGCGERLDKEENKEISDTTDIEESEGEIKKESSPIEDSNISDENILENNESNELEKPIKADIPSTLPEHSIISNTGLKKTCPSCNGKNLKNAKFCVVCGKKFDDEETESHAMENETVEEQPYPIKQVDDSGQELNKKSSIKTPPSEIKVPENIIKLKNTSKTGKIDNDIGTYNIPDEIESKKSEEKTAIVDPVERIKKAKELLDIGAITSEEFENIKKKYIELI